MSQHSPYNWYGKAALIKCHYWDARSAFGKADRAGDGKLVIELQDTSDDRHSNSTSSGEMTADEIRATIEGTLCTH
jgi:hypothetical protein